MLSFSSCFALLSAISTPLVATAYSVIDTQVVTTGDAQAAAGLQAVPDSTLASDEFILSEAITTDGDELALDEEPQRRSLLMRKRSRGTSRATPKGKKKSGKKKKTSKKKSSKKKSSKKKASSKKKSSKKKTTGKPAARSVKGSGKAFGAAKKAHGTHFSGMGSPTGGCGVPPGKAYDDNGTPLPFVALNTNSEFDNGSNCGRWVEIRLGRDCKGAGNTAYSICNGGKWVADGLTGDVIFGYVMDSCADGNFWCQDDTYHLDISRSYLAGMGMTSTWNGREITWQYMSGVAPGWKMGNPKFMWKSGSKWIPNGKGFYASVIIYNTSNGIGGVRQKVGSKWVNINTLNHLGNMWVLQRPPDSEYRSPSGGSGKSIQMQVLDVSGRSYGTFSVPWGCGSGVCGSETNAYAKKIG
eukprot:jgi/Ulvmu1/10859/UM007_0033.1